MPHLQMELISLLLLATALLPQTYGDYGFNSSDTGKATVDQNGINASQKFKASDLQTVFADSLCNNCIKCMERAITAHKISNHVIQIKNKEILNHLNEETQRKKRKSDGKNIKKPKEPAVNVAKYFAHGKLYALKVKENIENSNMNKSQKCDVYKVESFYPCDTTKGQMILNETKKNKKNKDKEQSKTVKKQ